MAKAAFEPMLKSVPTKMVFMLSEIFDRPRVSLAGFRTKGKGGRGEKSPSRKGAMRRERF